MAFAFMVHTLVQQIISHCNMKQGTISILDATDGSVYLCVNFCAYFVNTHDA